ncbi:MAG: septum formation initiator family protein [Candidatus Pacebacteria bacterium]|nr:septum formation initiator family protein [Candidatus Paceibacterota bacterium]
MISRKNKKENTTQGAIFAIAVAIITVLVTVFLVVSNWRINQRKTDLTQKAESLKKEIQTLEDKITNLKANATQTQNQEYLEQIARDNLGLKKEGEEVVVVTSEATTTEIKTEVKKNFWQKIWDKLGF